MKYTSRTVLTSIIFSASVGLVYGEESATESCDSESEITITNWQNWQKLTKKPIVSEGHDNSWVDIFVNELAADNYRNTRIPYPVCAKIVKVSYKDEEGKIFKGLTAMVKMPNGYDSSWGDWWYANYEDMGLIAKKQGRLFYECISCHRAALETDFLFSKEVMTEINEH